MYSDACAPGACSRGTEFPATAATAASTAGGTADFPARCTPSRIPSWLQHWQCTDCMSRSPASHVGVLTTIQLQHYFSPYQAHTQVCDLNLACSQRQHQQRIHMQQQEWMYWQQQPLHPCLLPPCLQNIMSPAAASQQQKVQQQHRQQSLSQEE